MANITKINLKGTEYILTDLEAQSLIAQLRESTYNKAEVDSLMTAIDNKIEGIDLASYETIKGAEGKYQPKGDYLTEHQDISGLATKEDVADAVAGMDQQFTNYVTKDELPSAYDDTELKDRVSALEANGGSDYDDIEIKSRLDELEAIDHSQYLTEDSSAIKDIENSIEGKADTVNVYAKEDTYNKTQIDEMVSAVNTQLNSKLPIDSFNEWSETVATKEEVSGKVDVEDGKGLSTNDYTDAEKAKLAATPTFWVGTQAEYDAISTKDNNTFYYIAEE